MIKLTLEQRDTMKRLHETFFFFFGPWQSKHLTDTYRQWRKRVFHKSITSGDISLRPIDGLDTCVTITPDGDWFTQWRSTPDGLWCSSLRT